MNSANPIKRPFHRQCTGRLAYSKPIKCNEIKIDEETLHMECLRDIEGVAKTVSVGFDMSDPLGFQ
jgi:hypothetical protein